MKYHTKSLPIINNRGLNTALQLIVIPKEIKEMIGIDRVPPQLLYQSQ